MSSYISEFRRRGGPHISSLGRTGCRGKIWVATKVEPSIFELFFYIFHELDLFLHESDLFELDERVGVFSDCCSEEDPFFAMFGVGKHLLFCILLK